MIRNDQNLGFGKACNQGTRVAQGKFLFFVNPDVELKQNSARELLNVAQVNADAGAIVPRLTFPDGRFQASCRKFPTMYTILFSRGSIAGRFLSWLGVSVSHEYTLPDYPVVTQVDAVAGTALLVDRELFQKIAGFDERFFLYMEDTDLSLRLVQSGKRNLFVPSATAIHGWGKGSSGSRLRREIAHHHSVWQYFLKHEANGFVLIVLPMLLVINLVISLIVPPRWR